MTVPSETPRDRREALEDRIWARWRWLIVLVVFVFVLNNLAGFLVGIVGVLALANRIAGRLMNARRLAQQVRQIVADPSDE